MIVIERSLRASGMNPYFSIHSTGTERKSSGFTRKERRST